MEGPPTEATLFNTSTHIALVTIGTDWGAFPGHQILPAIIVDTLWATHKGASP